MITLYHGSDYKFNKFEFKNVGKAHGTHGCGYGIYLTNTKSNALMYGKNIYTVQFQPKGQLYRDKKTLTIPKITLLLKKFEAIAAKNPEKVTSYVECWGLPVTIENIKKVAKEVYNNNESDVDILGDLINSTYQPLEILSVVVNMGYNYALDKETPTSKTVDNYVVYELNAMKIVKCEQPLNESVESVIEECEELIFDTLFESVPNELEMLTDQMERAARTKTLSEAQGRAKSKSQRRLMAMALAYKRGKLPAKYASDTIKKLANDIDQTTLHDFAKTNQKRRRKDGSVGKRNNIPDYVEGSKYKKKSTISSKKKTTSSKTKKKD